MTPPLYAAIILSAGLSSRMSSFKPLLKIGGLSLIDRTIGLFTKQSVDVYVVTGHQRKELETHITNSDVTLIENPDYSKGMFSSVKAGVSQLKEFYKAFFILPVDIPLVRQFTISKILETAKNNPDQIIYPVFSGKRGHPPLIPGAIIPSILESSGQAGLKGILEEFDKNSLEINVADNYILTDIDTDADYEAICRNFASYDIPSDQECEAMFDIYDVDPSRRLHCRKVAEIAALIGSALIINGHSVNQELIRAAATLHDIARNQHKHDLAGSRILGEMGFNRAAEIVAVHTFLTEDRPQRSLEATVVYLADKLVQGDRVVSVDERFRISFRRFAITAEIEKNIAERKRRANEIKKELEELIGGPLESVIN